MGEMKISYPSKEATGLFGFGTWTPDASRRKPRSIRASLSVFASVTMVPCWLQHVLSLTVAGAVRGNSSSGTPKTVNFFGQLTLQAPILIVRSVRMVEVFWLPSAKKLKYGCRKKAVHRSEYLGIMLMSAVS